ncbi:zinc metalloproteinase nas-13 [Folsomia candida]|uniref:zinc metalloproteinase nas-13 n=1 Tax=Folsomia candida TaxID=158441 RepID=UPI000B8F995B|nr:zinc metalloproteinase nas-13 [Folsomia candida]
MGTLSPFMISCLCLAGAIVVLSRPTEHTQDSRWDNFDERGPYMGGDVILPPGMDIRNGVIGDHLRWPNATLIYSLDRNFTSPELAIISEAMQEIEALTCIRFAPRNQNETGYIFVARGGPGTGCYSFLGRLGTVQQLNLENPGCIRKGIVMHEFIHAIGFYHEQSREDRDDYVTINWSNIQPGTEFNFLKATVTATFNVTYDYGSLMHYSKYSFATNTSIPTIIPIDPNAEIGQRERLSDKDIYKINAMYCPNYTT